MEKKNSCNFYKFDGFLTGISHGNTEILRDIENISGYNYYCHVSDRCTS